MATYQYRNRHTHQVVFLAYPEYTGNADWELLNGGGGGDGVSQAELDSQLGAVEADTTNIHGISNTALLETTTGAQAKADAAAAASIPLGQKGAASGVASLDSGTKVPVAQVPGLPGSIITSGTVVRARLPIGTDSSSVAAGDDSRITGAATISQIYASAPEVWADDPAFSTAGPLGGLAAFQAAIDAAELRGKHTIVRIPAGMVIDVGNGLSLAGKSVQIRGDGAGITGSTANASVIKASTQTGPVLDFTSYVTPSSAMGRITPLSGVYIQGSGVADPTKNNSGIRIKAMSSATFTDIAIGQTGGPCLELASNPGSGVYLSDFERITLNQPVGAAANDVPYFYANECNGNRFRGFGLRSISLVGLDVGVSGAALVEGNATLSPHDNLFDAWWYEGMTLPTNSTFFSIAGNGNIIRDFQFFDVSKESGATGTSYFRLAIPTTDNFGANSIGGLIPGRGTSPVNIDTGVDVRQDRNTIVGSKGYRGHNVTLASGASNTFIQVSGAYSGATQNAVDDNSGNTTNTYVDEYLGTISRKGVSPPAGSTDVQTFTSSGTWTKPAGAKFVDVHLLAGGPGGGSGRRGAAGSVRCGGGGGGGSGVTDRQIPAAVLGSSVTVTVGAGGAGGAAVTTDDTDGNPGAAGATTSFGTFARAGGPTAGGGGTATAGTAGVAGSGSISGSAGGAASATGLAGANSASSAVAGGGGAGGGITTGNAASAGGNGGASNSATASSGAGGVVDSTLPTSGTAITVGSGVPGSGGGGGASSVTTAAQAGANGGIYGASGGGGGASVNGNNSGAGGTGASGICIVTTYF